MLDYLPRDCKCHRMQLCEFRDGKNPQCCQFSQNVQPMFPMQLYATHFIWKQLCHQINIQIIKHRRADKQEVSSMPSLRHGLTISLLSTGSNILILLQSRIVNPITPLYNPLIQKVKELSTALSCLKTAAQHWQNPSHICLAKARVFSLEPHLLLAAGTGEMRKIHESLMCSGLLPIAHIDKKYLVV